MKTIYVIDSNLISQPTAHMILLKVNTVDFRFKQDVTFQIHLHKRVANFSRF